MNLEDDECEFSGTCRNHPDGCDECFMFDNFDNGTGERFRCEEGFDVEVPPNREYQIEAELVFERGKDEDAFLRSFAETPDKLAEKVDTKELLEEQYEECESCGRRGETITAELGGEALKLCPTCYHKWRWAHCVIPNSPIPAYNTLIHAFDLLSDIGKMKTLLENLSGEERTALLGHPILKPRGAGGGRIAEILKRASRSARTTNQREG